MTSLLATFNISKAKDEFGNVVEPVVDFKSASIVAYVVPLFSLFLFRSSDLIFNQSQSSLPAPFECSIKPRSREVEKLIYAAAEHSS